MSFRRYGWAAAGILVIAGASEIPDAFAGSGTVHLFRTTVSEQSSAWRLMMSLSLPAPPPHAHPTFRFLFTQTVAFERSLVDGDKVVLNKVALRGQNPIIETMEVDFADASGKLWKQTKFDFSMTRDRGYLAGEYKLVVKGPNGDVGSPQNITLEGENPVVDRRSMDFTRKAPTMWDGGAGSGIKPL